MVVRQNSQNLALARIVALLFMFGAVFFFLSMTSASKSFAHAHCGAALCAIEEIGGGGVILNPGIPTPGPAPAPAPGGGGGGTIGGGGGGPVVTKPGSYVVRMSGAGCAVKNLGYDSGPKAAIAKDQTYILEWKFLPQRTPAYENSGTWKYGGPMTEGYAYYRYVKGGVKCYYPPAVRYTTIQCSIRTYVAAEKILPNRKTVGTASGSTGYAEGSRNYNACVNSRGHASLRQGLPEYGYYEIYTWKRSVAARVEIATSPNQVTGVTPAPKIVSLGAPYNTSRVMRQSASLDCKNGFSKPGRKLSDWSENPCLGKPGQAFCQRAPIQYNVNGVMRSFPNNTIQFLRDGKERKMLFSQRVSGPNVRVTSQKTQFIRKAGSTPWKSSSSYNANLFHLSAKPKGGSILSGGGGTTSPWYNGAKNDVYISAVAAGESGKPTRIAQSVNWSGTRTIRSAIITGVNADTGAVTFSPITVTVPTSGNCTQEGTVEYVRSVGDTIR